MYWTTRATGTRVVNAGIGVHMVQREMSLQRVVRGSRVQIHVGAIGRRRLFYLWQKEIFRRDAVYCLLRFAQITRCRHVESRLTMKHKVGRLANLIESLKVLRGMEGANGDRRREATVGVGI